MTLPVTKAQFILSIICSMTKYLSKKASTANSKDFKYLTVLQINQNWRNKPVVLNLTVLREKKCKDLQFLQTKKK